MTGKPPVQLSFVAELFAATLSTSKEPSQFDENKDQTFV